MSNKEKKTASTTSIFNFDIRHMKQYHNYSPEISNSDDVTDHVAEEQHPVAEAAPTPTKRGQGRRRKQQGSDQHVQKDESTQKKEAPKKESGSIGKAIKEWRDSIVTRLVAGIILGGLGFWFGVAFLSYFSSCIEDQSMAANVATGVGTEVANDAGEGGARITEFLINQGFGVGAIVIVVWLLCMSMKLLIGYPKFRTLDFTIKSLIAFITLSVVVGMVSIGLDTDVNWGGFHGRYINEIVYNYIGWTGAIIISVVLISIFVVICLRDAIKWTIKKKRAYDERRRIQREAEEAEMQKQEGVEEMKRREKMDQAMSGEGEEIEQDTTDQNTPENVDFASDTDTLLDMSDFEDEDDQETRFDSFEENPYSLAISEEPMDNMYVDNGLFTEEEKPASEDTAPEAYGGVAEGRGEADASQSAFIEDADSEEKPVATEEHFGMEQPSTGLNQHYSIEEQSAGLEEPYEEQSSAGATEAHYGTELPSSAIEDPYDEENTYESEEVRAEPAEPATERSRDEAIYAEAIGPSDAKDDAPINTESAANAFERIEPKKEYPREEWVRQEGAKAEEDIRIRRGEQEAAKPSDEEDKDVMTVNVNQIEKGNGSTSPSYDTELFTHEYKFPPSEFLRPGSDKISVDADELLENKERIKQTLLDFGIPITSIEATVGPTVTLYKIRPDSGVKIAKIRSLADDLALSLAADGVRIIAPIPREGTVGIEVANREAQTVSMRTIIQSKAYQESKYKLPIALGSTISNEVYIADLAKMPHLLVAGATGQGKSVGLNAIVTSLLYSKRPEELKFVMVDPKRVEFSLYSKIENYYLAKVPGSEQAVITKTENVVATLSSLCVEMDERYKLLEKAFVRQLTEYNDKFRAKKLNPQEGHRFMPYIVVIIDEFADLIMTAGKDVELPIARLAQLARAVGIHVIIATQRPSTNVITGMIKANFPVRIAFKVSSGVDSKTILDSTGAQQLIGRGDMLISNNGEMTRVQCAFVDTPEVEEVCDYIARQPYPQGAFMLPEPQMGDGEAQEVDTASVGKLDPLLKDIARQVVSSGVASTSAVQRRYEIGYNRAGRIMDQLEALGVVGPATGGKPRSVLMEPMSLEDLLDTLG